MAPISIAKVKNKLNAHFMGGKWNAQQHKYFHQLASFSVMIKHKVILLATMPEISRKKNEATKKIKWNLDDEKFLH